MRKRETGERFICLATQAAGLAPYSVGSTVMAEESGIYAEDIVKNSQGVVGLVLEDAEETTDESESDEEALKKGQIVVCWYPSGNEETLSLSKVFPKDFPLNLLP